MGFYKFGVSMEPRLVKAIDTSMPKTNARSRSEFLSEAAEYYIAMLNKNDVNAVLTPALESVIKSTVQLSEDRIAKVLFKQGVELAMMMHVVAAGFDFDTNSLSDLRKTCTQEVSRMSGKYKFDDAITYEKGSL